MYKHLHILIYLSLLFIIEANTIRRISRQLQDDVSTGQGSDNTNTYNAESISNNAGKLSATESITRGTNYKLATNTIHSNAERNSNPTASETIQNNNGNALSTSSGVGNSNTNLSASSQSSTAISGGSITSKWIGAHSTGVPSGVTINDGGLTLALNHRLYMLDESGTKYQMLNVIDKTLSFDIDFSKVPCNNDLALYLVSMKSTADATKGEGYCDGNGVEGNWCSEFDLTEGNIANVQFTAHPCQGTSCDTSGSAVNNQIKNLGIDSSKPFTISTSFKNNKISQTYSQDGSMKATKSLVDDGKNGGFDQMFKSFSEGMVLVASLWTGGLSWLDNGCTTLQNTYKGDQIQGTISNIELN